MYNFDPYTILLVIATNIPQRLKTGFVVQGHIYELQVSLRHVENLFNITTDNVWNTESQTHK